MQGMRPRSRSSPTSDTQLLMAGQADVPEHYRF